MSGESLVILDGEAMVRLVRAAAKLAEANLGSYAIIGGVAVSARLGQAHRATADIDAVVDDLTPPPAIETLLDVPGARADPTGTHRVLIDGIKIEIQATDPFTLANLDGLTDEQILYVGAHRYALESATAMTLVAQAEQLRGRVALLVEMDARAFDQALRTLAERDEIAAPERDARLEQSLARAAELPLEIAEISADVAELAALASSHCNPEVRADGAAAAILAEAATRTAAGLVEVNLTMTGDDPRVGVARSLLTCAEESRGRVLDERAS